MMTLKNIGGWLSTALLVFTGAIGTFIGLSDIFGLERHFAEKSPIAILISMVGLLSLSLGFEHALHKRKLDMHLERVEGLLATHTGGRLLRGQPEIYAAALRPVSSATRMIRTVVYGKSAKAPADFGKAVARRLLESKKLGNPISFVVIFAINLHKPPQGFREGVEDRFNAIYKRAGVDAQVQLRVMHSIEEIGFDVLLVDEEHSFVAFPASHETVEVQTSIAFEGQPKLARELATWFDHRLKPASEDYWDWASKPHGEA